MKIWLLIFILASAFKTQAEVIVESKDWMAEKSVMTPLEKMGCVAQTTATVDVNGASEDWVLQVVALQTPEGEHSFPIVISFPKAQPTNEYYEARAVSDKTNSQPFSLTLLQPQSGDKTIVANRVADREDMVHSLKAYNTFTLEYLTKEGPTRTAKFSLRGSSRAISQMMESCQ